MLVVLQVIQVACGMHHTLVLAWPQPHGHPASSTNAVELPEHQCKSANTNTLVNNCPGPVVFGFGANRKGQCGVAKQSQEQTAANHVWEPMATSAIRHGLEVVEVTTTSKYVYLLKSCNVK